MHPSPSSFFLLYFVAISLIACSNSSTNSSSNTATESSDKAASVIPPAPNTENIDFKSLFEMAEQEELVLYNDMEEQLTGAPKAQTAHSVDFVKSLLSELEEGVERKILNGSNHGMVGTNGLEFVIVVDTNLPDDSLESDIRFFELRRVQQSWSLTAVTSVWRCYEGHGHQQYSTLPCD